MTQNTRAHLNRHPFDPSITFRELVRLSPADPSRKIMAISILVEDLSQEALAREFGVTTASLSRAKHSPTNEGQAIRGRIERRYGLAGCIFTSGMVNSLPHSLPHQTRPITEIETRGVTK